MNSETSQGIFTIRGIKVHPFGSFDQVIDYADSRKGILVAVNAEKTMNATDELKNVINDNIGYCDGAGAVKAGRRKGFANIRRTPGCELWLHIIRRFAGKRKFYLVGTRQEVIEQVVAKLRAEFPEIDIVGYRNGFLQPGDEEKLAADLERTRPDFVFVAMGSPKQELLMQRLKQRHPQAVYQGLGGSFDLYVGNFKRAPKLLQALGAEWLWRFIAQPSRIRRIGPYLRFASALYTNRL